MSIAIINALVEKNAFCSDTIITASYLSKDLFGRTYKKTGDFKLKRVIYTKLKHVFELQSIENDSFGFRTHAANIHTIDGMDIIRYADIYDILPNGMTKKVGKKRGRKTKTELSM